MIVKVYKCVLGHIVLTTNETHAAAPQVCQTCKGLHYLGESVENYMQYVGMYRFDTEILSTSTPETKA